jgi:hypothetical protein
MSHSIYVKNCGPAEEVISTTFEDLSSYTPSDSLPGWKFVWLIFHTDSGATGKFVEVALAKDLLDKIDEPKMCYGIKDCEAAIDILRFADWESRSFNTARFAEKMYDRKTKQESTKKNRLRVLRSVVYSKDSEIAGCIYRVVDKLYLYNVITQKTSPITSIEIGKYPKGEETHVANEPRREPSYDSDEEFIKNIERANKKQKLTPTRVRIDFEGDVEFPIIVDIYGKNGHFQIRKD